MQKVWLITGVSVGIGRALAQVVAEKGDIVYGTLRKPEQMADFEALVPGRTHAVLMDVNNPEAAASGVQQILDAQGNIDVLVNNAGFGFFGAIEEVDMEEIDMQMQTNFIAPLRLCQLVLPAMRKQGSGYIMQVSSVAGFRGTEGLGIYNASKFALEGFSQAMAKEVAPFGIHVTMVEPGPFRTEWGGRSSIRSKKVMHEYDHTAGARIRTIHTYSGTQDGDPFKAADLLFDLSRNENPPLHLPLGQMAVDGFREKMSQIEADIQTWEARSTRTQFD
ncbi:MAG: oxidoreductase [Bacteroidia bacterium]|jgi:NAD(P)-dependent dehydrogenase (short-subunit alcohol dehydrogenase family)